MTVVEIPSGAHKTDSAPGRADRALGGRFRLDERISLDDQVSGPCGSSWEARGLSLWKATDLLLARPVTIYLLPQGPVPRTVVDAVQSAAKVTDPRLATIYDTDFGPECPYIVTEWTPGSHLEDLVLSGLPHPALAAAMPPAPRHKGQVCTPRQVRAGIPALLDAITYRGLLGQAADAPLRPQTPAGLAMALRMVQRPSHQLDPGEEAVTAPAVS